MEAFRFSSRESAPNTMWCSLWRMTLMGNTTPSCLPMQTVNATYTSRSCINTFVQCSGENDDTWWYRTPSFFVTMQGATALLLSRTSCAAGNGRLWNIHRTHPIWVHAITISSPKWKNYCDGSGTRGELIRALGRSKRKINEDGRPDGVRHLPNMSIPGHSHRQKHDKITISL